MSNAAKKLKPLKKPLIVVESSRGFATRIITWQQREGRHHLPWQQSRDPYRVWLAEIMLQQTQVAAVIAYYEKFIAAFPNIAALAQASQDEVMQHWSGLGYYARARNLHAAAKIIMQEHDGNFPRDLARINALPGIGRSTAAAIGVFSFGAKAAILDGNVKRVFARHFGIEGDVKSKSIEEKYWTLAEQALPKKNIEAYTQGLMDLGALVCTRQSPRCLQCPIRKSCVALATGRIAQLPGKSVKKSVPHRQTKMLILLASGEVLLEKRANKGVWGGLWSLPEIAVNQNALDTAKKRFGILGRTGKKLDTLEHGFTHFKLSIYPQIINVSKRNAIANTPGMIWIAIDDAVHAALPAPVKKILRGLVGVGVQPAHRSPLNAKP